MLGENEMESHSLQRMFLLQPLFLRYEQISLFESFSNFMIVVNNKC